MDPRDLFPFPPSLVRHLGPPPPELMASLGLLPRPREREGRDGGSDDDDSSSSDGSFDTLRDALSRERARARAAARTADIPERPPRRSAPFSSRPLGSATSTAQDVLDLELDAQQTWSSLDRMRKWKDRLHRENKTLRAEVEKLKSELKEGRKRESEEKKEVERLKMRYEDVWKDKVMLAEQISGPASMPLEILLTVAGFVAGANNYGTLLNFSLVSKLIREEIKPVLYETMWFADERRFAYEGTKRHSDTHKYTKFVYVGEHMSASRVKKSFPNIRASFNLTPGSISDHNITATPDKEDYTPYNAQLTIFRPLPMSTLASLLEYPVKWVDGRHTKIHAIKGISSVDIEEQGALLALADGKDNFTFRNLIKSCCFRMIDMQQENMDESVKQLAKFVPVVPRDHATRRRGVWEPYPTITIYTSSQEELDAWLANLTSLLLRQPEMYVEFSSNGILTRAEFQDRVLRAASAYGSIWHQLKDSLKRLTASAARQEFFVMDYEHGLNPDMFRGTYGDPNGGFTLAGEFKCARTGDGFGVKIMEVDDETGTDRAMYDRPFDVPPA